MLHRLITRIASLLLVAGLLAAPAAAGAKGHHKRHSVRHHVAKHHRAAGKSVGRVEGGTAGTEPTLPTQEEPPPPVSDDPPAEPPASDDPPVEEQPPAPPVEQPKDAGVVASYGEGALDVELVSGGHVTGKVGQFTTFSCRSLATGLAVTEGCNASLLTNGRHVHEFTVNYGPEGAWFARIIIVLA